MALLHGHRGELPDSRVLLYEETVDLLLQRWERTNKPDLDRSRALQDWLSQARCQLSDLKRVLSRLAYQAHKRGGELAPQEGDARAISADIAEVELKLELARLHPCEELVWVQRGLELIKERAGLLVESQPGVDHIPHRTFQEYLAARFLGSQADYAKQALTLAQQSSYWWEALRLSAARLVQVEVGYQALGLVAALSPTTEPSVSDANAWRQIWLAGDLLKSTLSYAQNEPLGQQLIDRTRASLVRLLELGVLSARERCEAGFVLGALGDPRLGMEREDRWVWIAPGKFTMGSNDYEITKPPHQVTLTQGFWIGRYPVTNVEYQTFIVARGYHDRRWWSVEGGEWREQQKVEAPLQWNDERFNAPNQPVVGVSCYEAEAYCRWLTSHLNDTGHLLEAGQPNEASRVPREPATVFRLPTEAEWEYVARGQEGRKYPWGSTPGPDEERANLMGKVGMASPVGVYPLGETPEGVSDLAGNVWEWVSDWYDDKYYRSSPLKDPTGPSSRYSRVVRGGSWDFIAGYLRAAFRYRCLPGYRGGNVGFRVVRASPARDA